MKKSITNSLWKVLGGGFLAVLGMFPTQASAQYCGASNSWGCGTTYGGDITDVTITNASGTLAAHSGLGCSSTAPQIPNQGNPFDITGGEIITIEVKGTEDTYGWGDRTNVGVWIDLNRDNSFSAAECVVDPQTGSLLGVGPSNAGKATIKVPCPTKTGASRIRLRGQSSPYSTYLTKNNGCGTIRGYGSIVDYEINLKLGTPPTAGINVPAGPNYEKAAVTFNATNPNDYYDYNWNFNPPGTPASGSPATATGKSAKSTWANPGTYDVKLLVNYCGIKDSITSAVKIVQPTSAPVADFIASANEVEIYYNVQLFDLSTNGAYSWIWTVTSPLGNVYNFTNQNPIITLDEEGKWDFCLESANYHGYSAKVCKNKYVECVPPSEFYMGPNKIGTNKTGTLYDNGGPSAPYGANRKVTIDYFKIIPCGAKEIRLRFKSLKLADAGDRLRIYDGGDESAPLLTPATGINGGNQATYRNAVIKATSGQMYITFESNGSGVDSGFIAVWESDLLPPKAPVSDWTTEFDPIAVGMDVTFKQNVQQAQGAVDYNWGIDDNFGGGPTFDYSYNSDFVHNFGTTAGNYGVCLIASTCNGADTFCKNITVITPSKPGLLDFVASNVRPRVGDVVNITTTSDYATNYEWSIFPLTYSLEPGSSLTSKNPKIRFNAGGSYTFTLKAWNAVDPAATEKKVIKNKYVVVLDYCTPTVNILSSDIGVNKVVLSKDGATLFDNESTSGQVAYTDYTEEVQATLTYGATYDVALARKTFSNSVNYKVWIDFNIDGDFNDAGEEVLNSGVITGTDASSSFTVPELSASFEGATRMRVGASFGSFPNAACGVNTVGEYEDYRIILANDNKIPVITLVGSDTVRVEKGSTPTSCYSEVAGLTFTAADPTQGDMTSKVIVTTDLDCTVPGIYEFQFNVKDASGNVAETKRRTVIVVLDRTAPTLTLNGVTPMTVEQCDNFTDPGAVAVDAVDGNLSTAIIVSGTVNASAVGSYTLTYTVSDAQGNTASIQREVIVQDTKKPGIYVRGARIVNNSTVNVQINSVFVDDVYGEDVCNGAIPVTKTAGFNGYVNTQSRATYPITYTAVDPSGNTADEQGYVINYRVDDYIAPEIALNTDDVIIHDVNAPYVSKAVTVSDNYYPLSKVSVVKTGTVDPYTLGTYTESYTATDESGNSQTVVRTVIVVDRVAPAILAPATNVCVGTPFWAYSGLVISDNYYSPATLLPLVKVLNHNVNIWEAGVYYINYELTDPSGNKALMVSRPVFVQYPPNCTNTFTGVEDIRLEDAVTVYPNPTKGEITVGYTITNNSPINISVTNMVGATVAELNNIKGGFGSQSIDLGKFGNGTYMVRITNNGETTVKKVVVAK